MAIKDLPGMEDYGKEKGEKIDIKDGLRDLLPEPTENGQKEEDKAKFTLVFKHVTLAPPQDPRRMIWAEFYNNDAYQTLDNTIKQTINQFLREHEYDIQKPHKQAIPHITLARCGPSFKPPAAPLPQLTIANLDVCCLQLMESQINTD